jgi:glycosyltransferase involved in cell wall biosynthesis
MSHLPSFEHSGVEQALANVFRKRKNVRFFLCGDERVYKRLPIPEGRKKYFRYVRFGEWPKIFKQADLTIAPLALEYDMRRSDLKLGEASLCGIPIVATRSPVYEGFEKNGVGMYVSNGVFDGVSFEKRVEEWETALLETIDNLSFYTEKAQKDIAFGYEYRDVDRNVGELVDTYSEIIGRLS